MICGGRRIIALQSVFVWEPCDGLLNKYYTGILCTIQSCIPQNITKNPPLVRRVDFLVTTKIGFDHIRVFKQFIAGSLHGDLARFQYIRPVRDGERHLSILFH